MAATVMGILRIRNGHVKGVLYLRDLKR